MAPNLSADLGDLPPELTAQIALNLSSVDDFLHLSQTSQRNRLALAPLTPRQKWHALHFGGISPLNDPDAWIASIRASSLLGLPMEYTTLTGFLAFDMRNWIWDALSWFLRAQLLHVVNVLDGWTIFNELTSISSPVAVTTREQLTYAWSVHRYGLEWAARFCRIVFRGTMLQRRACDLTAAMPTTADYLELQRRFQDAIISISRPVGDVLVKATVPLYDK
ncbi:hypothetical protein HKX48_002463 [Thoreauomyces humboldtii]|nr:hypothetical protein HKX48_002463 [Thoreauomyces humboldtii]